MSVNACALTTVVTLVSLTRAGSLIVLPTVNGPRALPLGLAATFGGVATISPFANAEAALRTADLAGPLLVLGSPASIAKWRVNPRSATLTTRAILEDANRIAGMGVMASGNLPGNRVLIGQFGAVQVLEWAVEIMSNPYSLALDGEVIIAVNLLCDVRVSRSAAFTASTDSGAA